MSININTGLNMAPSTYLFLTQLRPSILHIGDTKRAFGKALCFTIYVKKWIKSLKLLFKIHKHNFHLKFACNRTQLLLGSTNSKLNVASIFSG